ncbi:MAG: hypothetical protein HY784_05080 [Chloroflexi bacterium]|nr:hypothetical protein [Chloroflexota bacterium]
MTLETLLLDIHAMREDLLVFERKYGIPTEVFYDAYRRGEEPAETAWVLDWGEWAATYRILQDRLLQYTQLVHQMLTQAKVASFSELVQRTARHEPIALPG